VKDIRKIVQNPKGQHRQQDDNQKNALGGLKFAFAIGWATLSS